MKEHRVKPSNAVVTSIDVSGRFHHFAHSERLGKFRAILIGEDENLPVPFALTDKGKKAVAKSKRPKLEQDSQKPIVQEQAAKAPKPLSKGEKLKLLMDCADRLHYRYQAFFKAYSAVAEGDYKGRAAAFAKMQRVHKASNRITEKIADLLSGKAPIFSPCPTQFFGTLKNSELRAAHEEQKAIWVNYWDSDLNLFDDAYGDISEKLNLINDEIEKREKRGNWS